MVLGYFLDHRVYDHGLSVQGGRRSLLCGSWVPVLITEFMITDCVSREVGVLSYVVLGYLP